MAGDGELILESGDGATRLVPHDAVRQGDMIVHRFRNKDSGETIAFVEQDGRIARYLSAGGVNRATRVSLFASPEGFFAVLLLGVIASLAAVISGISRLLAPTQPRARARLVGVLMPATGAAWLVTLAFFGAYFQRAALDEWVVFADWPGEFAAGAWAGALAAALTALSTLTVAFAWLKAHWSVWRRARIVTTLLALIALAAMLYAWNMLGPRF